MTDANPRRQLTKEELDIAADWAVRFEDQDLTSGEQAEYEVWVSQFAERRHAVDAVRRMMSSDLFKQALSEFDVPEASSARELISPVRGLLSYWRKWWLAPAALVASIALAFLYLPQRPVLTDPVFETFQTATAERRDVILSDKSRIEMNARTKFDFAILSDRRQLKLTDGEVFFDVANNETAPFLVSTAHGQIEVTGTKFNVDASEKRLQVSVVEGSVRVRPNFGSDQLLVAGNVLTIEDGYARDAGADTAELISSWRDGWLQTDGMTLQDVIIEIERYTDNKIFVPDRSSLSMEVAGRFRLDDPQVTLSNVSAALGLSVEEADERYILLSN